MKVRRSLVYSLLQRYVGLVLSLLVTMFSARMLSPEDFGAFAIAHAIIGALTIFAEAGVGNYLTQEQRLTTDKLRSAFSVTLVIGLGLSVVLIAGHTVAGQLFGSARVGELILILTLVIALSPFNAVRTGLLLRWMKFRTLMVIGTLGSVALAGVTVIGLLLGLGVYALAWGVVVEAVVLTVGINAGVSWQRPSLSSWRAVVAYGAPLSGANLLRALGVVLPQVVVGRTSSLAAAGLLNRSMTINNLFARALLQGIKPVVVPAFAVHRRREGTLGRVWFTSLVKLCSLAWPFFLFLCIYADFMVRILFGPDWSEIVPLVRLLTIGAMATPITSLSNDVLCVTGHVREQFSTVLWSQGIRAALVVLIACTIGDVAMVVAGLAVCMVIEAVFVVQVTLRVTATKWRALTVTLAPTAVISLVAMVPGAVGLVLLDPSVESMLSTLVPAAAVTGVTWFALLLAVRHPIGADLMAMLGWGLAFARRLLVRFGGQARGALAHRRALSHRNSAPNGTIPSIGR